MRFRSLFLFFALFLSTSVLMTRTNTTRIHIPKGSGTVFRNRAKYYAAFQKQSLRSTRTPMITAITNYAEPIAKEFFWSLLENVTERTAALPDFFKATCIDFIAYRLALGILYLVHRNFSRRQNK